MRHFQNGLHLSPDIIIYIPIQIKEFTGAEIDCIYQKMNVKALRLLMHRKDNLVLMPKNLSNLIPYGIGLVGSNIILIFIGKRQDKMPYLYAVKSAVYLPYSIELFNDRFLIS